jgi:hypothetical protein
MNTHIQAARTLTDDALLARVEHLAARERGATAELIAHLAEVDARELYLGLGYGSLFTYCRGALLLSESATYKRIQAARAVQRFPVILERLIQGAVSLTTVKLLAPHLTVENHLDALESARGRSRPEVEEIVARLAPAPDVAASVRKLPVRPASTVEPVASAGPQVAPATTLAMSPAAAPSLLAAPATLADPPPPSAATGPPPAAPTGPLPTARPETHAAVVNPLSPGRYKLQLTISGDTLDKLRLAKDMIRHALPSGDESQIIDRALTLLLTDLAKTRFAATDRPQRAHGKRKSGGEKNSRHVPAEVKRIVWVRDLGRCAFVSKGGHRCEARTFLEFHHVHPYAEGGPPTVANIELQCRRHNRYEWELRSIKVRRSEEEWLRRQVAAGVDPWRSSRTGSGASCVTAGRARIAPRSGPDRAANSVCGSTVAQSGGSPSP